MNCRLHERAGVPVLLGAVAYSCVACVAALGPGYTIEKQEISVAFAAAPEPIVRVSATYQLRNAGNQPLNSLELRLPGRRRFHFVEPLAEWDSQKLSFAPSAVNARNSVLSFPRPWTVGKSHTLRLSVEYQRAPSDENTLSFTPEAFFLPAQGWSPDLLPVRGIFATGGVPPPKWNLIVQVPDDFLVHLSGRASKTSHRGKEQTVRAVQQPKDGYPFVIAGRFSNLELKAEQETLHVWTRSAQKIGALRPTSDALVRAIKAYDAMFGNRGKGFDQLWVVECPAAAGCFSNRSSNYAQLLSDQNEKTSAEMAAADTVMVDLSNGAPEMASAAPSLAASWLGYGRNPGFFEQVPPMSALPAFAAFRAREAVEGPQVRQQTIRRLLSQVPVTQQPRKAENETELRAKSVLFFYGLQDRYGSQPFDAALRNMLEARRGGGFDQDDLIAAMEQEIHQNVAQFVRLWMKHPGVPAEFRTHYENTSAALGVTSKETQ